MYPSTKLDLNRYPLIRALMTAKHGVSRGNPWHLIIELFGTHSELTDTEWYDLADFLEATMALNGFEMTAEDYERFVQAHDGSPPWSRLIHARKAAFEGRTTTNKFPIFSTRSDYTWCYYEQAKSGTFTLQPRAAPAPADKRRRVSSPDYEQVAKQWAAMKVLLESLGCWQGDAPPSLQDALRKELITPAQHKVYAELHQDMNRVRH